MASFDLLYQPWIPCLTPEGERRELGIEKALVSAHKLAGIEGDSPIETAALHRLLLAILHRVFGPKDYPTWNKLWEKRSFDERRLKAYFSSKKCAGRFDLFDEERPFYQVGRLDLEQYASPVSRLCPELASGNNATLFDHCLDASAPTLTPPQAARRLVAFHAFAPGGLVTYKKGEDPRKYKSADAAPLSRAVVILVRSGNLFETLLLNLQIYKEEDELPFASRGEDAPAWERERPTRAADRRPAGYLDALTWQSRRIRLGAEECGSATLVTGTVVMKGHQFPERVFLYDCETMVPFRENPKAKAGEEPRPPLRFREERSLWRDSIAFVQRTGSDRHAVRALEHVHDLLEHGYLASDFVLDLEANGICTDRAKIDFWRHETLPLPVTYLKEPGLVVALSGALSDAGKGNLALAFATNELGAYVSSAKAWAELSGRAKDAARRLADSLAPGRYYWPRLETRFKELMVGLLGDRSEFDGEPVYGDRRLPEWRDLVVRKARQAFDEAVRGLEGSPRALRAVARGRWVLNGKLAELAKGSGEEGGGS